MSRTVDLLAVGLFGLYAARRDLLSICILTDFSCPLWWDLLSEPDDCLPGLTAQSGGVSRYFLTSTNRLCRVLA